MRQLQHLELFFLLGAALSFTSVVESRSRPPRPAAKVRGRVRGHMRSDHSQSGGSRRPNIILVLTDDQDVVLGSMTAMNKTKYHLGSRGAEFTNAFVTTPMCCPSRSSILTGQYVHNHQVFSNIAEYCVSDEWRMGPEMLNFGTYLQSANYRTGYFGKYLNEYRGDYMPPGWVEWVGLVKNSKFYNYTLCRNGQLMRHGFDYHRDYLPDLIANDSIAFFKLSKRAYPRLPVAMVLSFPSPHGPEDGAPQYRNMFLGNRLHRTPAWSYGPNEDKHWVIRQANQLSEVEEDFTDALQRKRLITLLSVDDAIEKLCRELEALGELDNTYILMTSDHGYHLGQFNMLKGKSNPYDTDIRVPFYIRGPEIPPGIRVPNIVLNIDLAPTILDMAGVSIPTHMDGVSIMKLFQPATNYKVTQRKSKKWKYIGKEPWRQSFLVEKTRSPEEMSRYRKRINKPSKAELLEMECEKAQYQPPCQKGQAKVCVRDPDGSIHLRKCRINHKTKCQCVTPVEPKADKNPSRAERRQQRKFLKKHASQDDFKPVGFIRGKRAATNETQDQALITNNEVLDSMCRVLRNETVICDNEVFASRQAWREHRKLLEKRLRYLRRYMGRLKEIKTFLRNYRPDKGSLDEISQDGSYILQTSEDELRPSVENEGTMNPNEVEGGGGEEERCVCRDVEVVEPEEEDLDVTLIDDQSDLEDPEDEDDEEPPTDASDVTPYVEVPLTNVQRDDQNQVLTKEERLKAKARAKKLKRKEIMQERKPCRLPGMSCFNHGNEHWKTPPFWTRGAVCACLNTFNNSYYCLRTINETHNFLYCEFVTSFQEYFDMRPQADPHQLTNTASTLDPGVHALLHQEIDELRTCRGKRCAPSSKSRKALKRLNGVSQATSLWQTLPQTSRYHL